MTDPNGDSYRILLIDDEERMVRALGSILEREGYQSLVATSGTEGLAIAAEKQPDLIICDVAMPPPDGFEVREILNRRPDIAKIPFIFVTARVERADRLRGIEAGADDYIAKPFDVAELLLRIEAILRRVQVSREEGAKEVASRLEVMRQEIFHAFTHELRTPLSHIMLSLEMVLEDKFGENRDEQLRFLGSAMRGAERLRRLIDDLLLLNLSEEGGLSAYRQRVWVDIHVTSPIQACVERWQQKNLDVVLNVGPDLEIYAPRDRFQQAVVHLVDNACKFSPDGGRIVIDLQSNGEGGCVLTVADQGPGIAPEHRERVFDRYYQVSSGDGRRYEGLGVGLTIARAVARSLGGDVTILESPSGASGCVVRMTIPPGEPDTLATHITNRASEARD